LSSATISHYINPLSLSPPSLSLPPSLLYREGREGEGEGGRESEGGFI